MKFHNGEPFDAEAVRYSIERYLNPDTKFPARPLIDSIAKANVIDPYTVEIVTKYPDGLLLSRLAGFIVIVPPKYVSENPWILPCIATTPWAPGAFCFCKSWDPDRGKQIDSGGQQVLLDDGLPQARQAGLPVSSPTEDQAKLLP